MVELEKIEEDSEIFTNPCDEYLFLDITITSPGYGEISRCTPTQKFCLHVILASVDTFSGIFSPQLYSLLGVAGSISVQMLKNYPLLCSCMPSLLIATVFSINLEKG